MCGTAGQKFGTLPSPRASPRLWVGPRGPQFSKPMAYDNTPYESHDDSHPTGGLLQQGRPIGGESEGFTRGGLFFFCNEPSQPVGKAAAKAAVLTEAAEAAPKLSKSANRVQGEDQLKCVPYRTP